jgi:ubiquinone biosynthesis protein UbiJ
LLVEAIKDQQPQIDELKQRLDRLEKNVWFK